MLHSILLTDVAHRYVFTRYKYQIFISCEMVKTCRILLQRLPRRSSRQIRRYEEESSLNWSASLTTRSASVRPSREFSLPNVPAPAFRRLDLTSHWRRSAHVRAVIYWINIRRHYPFNEADNAFRWQFSIVANSKSTAKSAGASTLPVARRANAVKSALKSWVYNVHVV